MAGSTLALLLFSLAVATAVPQNDRILDSINWPEDAPTWWPGSFPWPPALPEDAPSFWPDWLPWPIELPTAWPPQPEWWPGSLPWPPALPDAWPDKPDWWPDSMDWPPNRPQQWPNRPANWPAHLPWPPTKPEHWPDRPSFWPESLPWPPALPNQWPPRPEWLPDLVPWPPALPEFEWPPPGVNPDNIPYVPSRDNEFHLFTRYNPTVSHPLVINNYAILQNSNFHPHKPTVVLVHNIRESAYASINSVLVPAYLNTIDANVIVVDWSAGAWSETVISTLYSVASGNFVARFLDWLSVASGAHHEDFHLVGVGLGGLKVGFIGLRLRRQVGYITALDPAQGPELTRYLPPLSPNVAKYSEVIHTDAGYKSWAQPLGHVDFYPNGGQYQPGCGGESTCNRNRAIYFLAESIQHGGFTGVQCDDWRDALTGSCYGPKTLNLGGVKPKTGKRGVFYVRTNALPPFSQG